MPKNSNFLTIRQAAKVGPLTEHYLRLRCAQGKLPGIWTGCRFMVNMPLLLEMLDAESRTTAGMPTKDTAAAGRE